MAGWRTNFFDRNKYIQNDFNYQSLSVLCWFLFVHKIKYSTGGNSHFLLYIISPFSSQTFNNETIQQYYILIARVKIIYQNAKINDEMASFFTLNLEFWCWTSHHFRVMFQLKYHHLTFDVPNYKQCASQALYRVVYWWYKWLKLNTYYHCEEQIAFIVWLVLR